MRALNQTSRIINFIFKLKTKIRSISRIQDSGHGLVFLLEETMIQEKISNEYNRLLHLFKDVDENKTKLVDELLMKAAFLKVQLDELEVSLKKHGAIQISNKGNARESINYKTYLKTLTVYQGIIKTLSIVMGRNTIDDDDEFDEFLRTANL